MPTKSTSSQAERAQAERVLGLMGYDRELLASLSEKHRGALRGAAASWLVACLVLGGAAGYAAWLILPGILAPLVGSLSVTLLTINLLRVVHAGGGSELRASRTETEEACKSYRPSLVPALVFVVLAAILAQPAQIPFWSDLEPKVEEHRQTLIAQHRVAAEHLGTDADYYGEELMAAGFPIFRLKLIWQDPKRAVRLTFIVLALVLLPAIWSQGFAIESVRAYELERGRRTRRRVAKLQDEANHEVRTLLSFWPGYQPSSSQRSPRRFV